MQLVGHLSERRREIRGRRQLEIAASGCRGQILQPRIRSGAERPSAETATASAAVATAWKSAAPAGEAAAVAAAHWSPAAVPAARAALLAREADRVHHHVLFLRALHHGLQRAVAVPEVHRLVVAVREGPKHAPPPAG